MTRITEENKAEWYGHATLSPSDPVAAGSYGTWTVRYVVGKYGIDDGGVIKVAYKMASDMPTPQMTDPVGDDYLTVRTTGSAKLRSKYENRGYLRPLFRTIKIDVYDGSLVAGDEVMVTFGDTSGGSRGTRAQTFIDDDFRFVVAIEAFQTGVFYEVPGTTRLRVVGAEARKLVALAPSRVAAGEETWVMVKAQDEFGNLAGGYRGSIMFGPDAPDAPDVPDATSPARGSVQGLPEEYRFTGADGGSHWFRGVRFTEPGLYRIEVADVSGGGNTRAGGRLAAQTNPIEVVAAAGASTKVDAVGASPSGRIYWGDFHGQTKHSVGTGTVEQYFEFARDRSALDFAAHNANDFQVRREHWQEIKDMTRKFNQPGVFVTFLGTEWSGSTPAGGDHNVYYPADEAPLHRSSHWQVPDKSDEYLDAYPVDELYRVVRADGLPAMVVPHVGGRYANLNYHDPALEHVVEVCSAHGRFEWLLQDAIRRGYKVGVVANSDDHTGRPGASYPTKGHFHVRGGLTAVFAESRTREAIWRAIEARRCYATSGERIILDFRLGEHVMGEEVILGAAGAGADALEFRTRVSGTAGIYQCELKRGLETIYTFRPDSGRRNPDRIRVAWGGARLRSRDRASRWTGGLSLEGGKIVGVEGFAFDAPWEGVRHWDEHAVRWESTTAGDIDGVLLDTRAPDDAVLRFETPTATFAVTLGEVRGKDLRFDAGLLDQHVCVSTAATQPNPADVEFSFTDLQPPAGTTPYYVVVLQDNGEMAWSSPIFVTVGQDVS